MVLTRLLTPTLFALINLQGVLGGLYCEHMPAELFSFSVSSLGTHCFLEKFILRDGTAQYACLKTDVMADDIFEWIEMEECVDACGVDRMAVGMSSDDLLEADFIGKLCSSQCYTNCPNIVDLYFNLAAGEGLDLPSLCKAGITRPRRMVAETRIMVESFGISQAPLSSFSDSADTISPATSPSAWHILFNIRTRCMCRHASCSDRIVFTEVTEVTGDPYKFGSI